MRSPQGSFRSILGSALVLLAVSLAPHPAVARSAGGRPAAQSAVASTLLTNPRELAEWIVDRHPDVVAADARVQEAEAGVDQSRVLPNPTLGVGVGGILVGSSNPSGLHVGDTMNVTVGLSETIELGKRGPRSRAAELRRGVSRASRSDVLVDRVADAREALARIIYLTERGRVLEERLTAAEDVAGLAKVRLEHGDISGIDQDRLILEAISVSRVLAENRDEREAALSECASVLAAPCTVEAGKMDAVDAAAPVPAPLGDLRELVLQRPDLRAARLASAAAREDAVYYRRQAIPDPTVSVSYSRDFLVYAGNQPHTMGAAVSLPLPIFDHGQHLARQAESQATAWRASEMALTRRGLAEAQSLLARKSLLETKLKSLVETGLPRSSGVLESSENAYRRGQLSLTDLLLVRREHASLLLDALDTRYELFFVRNLLYRTLGITTTFDRRSASRE